MILMLNPATVNDATKRFTLGGVYQYHGDGTTGFGGATAPAGLYRYMRNAADATTIAGEVAVAASLTDYVVTAANRASAIATPGIPRGVFVAAVLVNRYCFVLMRGTHQSVVTTGTVTAGRQLTAGAATGAATNKVNAYDPVLGDCLQASPCIVDVKC